MHGNIHTDGLGANPVGTIDVPDVIPIFPLPKTVLLPGEVLPLHIFEPRYRSMVRDALGSHRVIGIVEATPDTDTKDVGAASVRSIGCVGFIAQHQELPDGRFLLWLLGLERFRIDEELHLATMYRQVRVSYTPAEESVRELAGIRPVRHELRTLLPTLIDADTTTREMLTAQMEEVSDTQIIALACQILELDSQRKQQILEAATQVDRFLMVYEDVYRHLDLNPDLDEIDESELN
jgi:Lon protease-like protein